MIHSTKRLLWLLLVVPALSFAQPGEVLSLPEILQRIEESNLLLQTYGLRADSYRYRAEAATAWMAPMVGVGTFMTPYPGQMIMEPRDRGMLMFRVEQQFPNVSRQRAERRYIESQGDAERTARSVALNSLRAQARSSYFAWLVSAQKIRVLEKNEEVLQMMKKIEEVRYPFNQSPLSGIYRADAEIEKNKNMITMQVGDIERAEATLNALMNRPSGPEFQIDTSYQPRFVPVTGVDTSLLAAQRSDIIRMNQEIRSMQLNIEAMQLQRKPEFRIQFDHMAPLSRMPQSFSLMGMVTIPFASWSSRMYKSDVRAMELSIRAMEKERAAMLQETRGMLYAMQAEIRAMQARIASMETKVIPALQRAFDANFLVYQENKQSLTVLLETWEALNMMQMDLLDERGKLYQMIVDYEKELYR
ncbi:TolC family protein [Telluribacter humicola]|uniref:TolC family protein n=1 Tax=Telluribacter humicola TaxID=1720261 RepID=UPI001A96413A|nr:TolC family protein [Telluribacter humicola]